MCLETLFNSDVVTTFVKEFLPARRYASEVFAVIACLSVYLSVCRSHGRTPDRYITLSA